MDYLLFLVKEDSIILHHTIVFISPNQCKCNCNRMFLWSFKRGMVVRAVGPQYISSL